MRRTVHISGQIEPFFGTLDENVRLLEDSLRVRTHLHDTRLTIEGERDDVDRAVTKACARAGSSGWILRRSSPRGLRSPARLRWSAACRANASARAANLRAGARFHPACQRRVQFVRKCERYVASSWKVLGLPEPACR